MISFDTTGSAQMRDFLLLKMSGLYYREDNPGYSLSYRFLLCGTQAYLYNSITITVVKPQEEPDVLEFTAPQDFLLGEKNHNSYFICNNMQILTKSSIFYLINCQSLFWFLIFLTVVIFANTCTSRLKIMINVTFDSK